MQDERAARRLVEDDEPVAVGRDGDLRMCAVGVRILVEDRMSGVAASIMRRKIIRARRLYSAPTCGAHRPHTVKRVAMQYCIGFGSSLHS